MSSTVYAVEEITCIFPLRVLPETPILFTSHDLAAQFTQTCALNWPQNEFQIKSVELDALAEHEFKTVFRVGIDLVTGEIREFDVRKLLWPTKQICEVQEIDNTNLHAMRLRNGWMLVLSSIDTDHAKSIAKQERAKWLREQLDAIEEVG